MSAALGVALTFGGAALARRSTLPLYAQGATIVAVAGAALFLLACAAALSRRHAGTLLDDPEDALPGRISRHPQVTLFLASFVALFVELALIRYTASQLRVFSFFKNVPLIASYLGLGVGCALGGGRPRHVLLLLVWFIPLAVVLAEGTLLVSGAIGTIAALATSEQILGDISVAGTSTVQALAGQAAMGAFCVVTLFVMASLFIPLGRLLGDAFDRLPRLRAYSINIVGSLAGTGVFILAGYLWTPPWVWLLIGFAPLLWWLSRPRHAFAGTALIAMSAIAVVPSVGETIWSPYQKLVGAPVKLGPNPYGPDVDGYLVDISDVFYQVAVDLRPAAVARAGNNVFPHYDAAFTALPRPIGRVLIVGAGTGNDVAAALRAGAANVDAVDIDPAIVRMGRLHHPEQPYSDARVHVIIDDARASFRRLPAGRYDAVLFGLLDSHTQLGMSSVRLDNYVFTQESFDQARRLLKPGGRLVVTAATFRSWFRERFVNMLETTCGSAVQTRVTRGGTWVTYECAPVERAAQLFTESAAAALPTDDWPFLYLPSRAVPSAYVFVVVMLALGSVLVIRRNGLSPKGFSAHHGHLFFLGAAFLLMEVYAINRLALLFGTTWIVSAVAIVVVLTLIMAANVTVSLLDRRLPYTLAYAGLFIALAVSYLLGPAGALGRGLGVAIAYAFAALLPVYFAGIVFARSFTSAPVASAAIGANMLGAVVGGWAEYSSMALGIRALVLVAMAFYAASYVCLKVFSNERSPILAHAPATDLT